MQYTVSPRGVCPSKIRFELEGEVLKNVSFTGGCSGNLEAISRIVEGMTVSEIAGKFLGIRCGYKPTSCSDQLAQALLKAFEEEKVRRADI